MTTDSQLAKFEGKLEVTAEIGEKCQEQSTAAEREAQGRKGAAEAMGVTASQIHKQLVALLDKEWADGEFSDCDSPELARAKVKRCISRAVGLCEHLAQVAKNAELVSSGRAAALQMIVDLVGRHNDVAAKRVRQLKAPPEPTDQDNPDLDGKGNPRRRPGDRPVTKEEMTSAKSKAPVPAKKPKPGKKKSGKKAVKRKRGRKNE